MTMASIGLLLTTLVFICVMVSTGHGLQCYSATCSNSTGGGPSSCPPAEKLTCGKMEGTDMDLDRCVTQRVKMQQNGQTVYQQMRNCSHSMQCTSAMRDMFCNAANSSGSVVKCEMGCCEGDLCNDGHVIPTFPPPGPSGADLDCYSCSMIPIPGISVKQAPCSKPARQNCGGDGMIPNMPQDRCISIKVSAGAMGSYEIRNCSSQYFCMTDLMCKTMNSSGMITSCDVSCCSGSYCNGDAPSTSSPTIKSTAAATLCNIWYLVVALIAVKMG